MKDHEHLQWIHDRLINVHNYAYNADFMIRFREIIQDTKNHEEGLEMYLKFIARNKTKNNNE